MPCNARLTYVLIPFLATLLWSHAVDHVCAGSPSAARTACSPHTLVPFYETCRHTGVCQADLAADECQACVIYQAQSAYYGMLVNALYICRSRTNPLGIQAPASPMALHLYQKCVAQANSDHRNALVLLDQQCREPQPRAGLGTAHNALKAGLHAKDTFDKLKSLVKPFHPK